MYMAVALSGAVIEDQRGPLVHFREKCERCGTLQPGTRTTTTHAVGDASSRLRSSFRCIKCGNHQDILIRGGVNLLLQWVPCNPADRADGYRAIAQSRRSSANRWPSTGGIAIDDEASGSLRLRREGYD